MHLDRHEAAVHIDRLYAGSPAQALQFFSQRDLNLRPEIRKIDLRSFFSHSFSLSAPYYEAKHCAFLFC
jgi:hypothetical protein